MSKFSKADLVVRITESNDIASAKAASRIVELFINTVKEQVAAGKQVDISGLCSFKPAIQGARSGISSLSGLPFSSPAKKVVKIRPAAAFKAAVAE